MGVSAAAQGDMVRVVRFCRVVFLAAVGVRSAYERKGRITGQDGAGS